MYHPWNWLLTSTLAFYRPRQKFVALVVNSKSGSLNPGRRWLLKKHRPSGKRTRANTLDAAFQGSANSEVARQEDEVGWKTCSETTGGSHAWDWYSTAFMEAKDFRTALAQRNLSRFLFLHESGLSEATTSEADPNFPCSLMMVIIMRGRRRKRRRKYWNDLNLWF